MTPFSRQKDIEKRGNWLPKIIKESKNLRSQEKRLSSGSILNLYYDYFGDSWGYDSSLAMPLKVFKMSQKFTKSDWLISFSIVSQVEGYSGSSFFGYHKTHKAAQFTQIVIYVFVHG